MIAYLLLHDRVDPPKLCSYSHFCGLHLKKEEKKREKNGEKFSNADIKEIRPHPTSQNENKGEKFNPPPKHP